MSYRCHRQRREVDNKHLKTEFYLSKCLLRPSLTYDPAVPALQGRGGTGDRTVGAVLVASLARHGRGEGGAGAPCGG